MNAIFALGNRASAEAIRGRLSRPPGDSAVRVMSVWCSTAVSGVDAWLAGR
ncbi:MAG TPA: hypothetical protein VN515_10440 [Terriglobales bacterium]|nr:hypothetical protein [Terriglobales bacterium]